MGITLLLCILVLIGLLYRHVTRNFSHWKDQNVPYLPPVPFFGNIFKTVAAKQSLGQLAQEVYNYAKSNCIGFFIFDQPFLLIRDPNLIKNILIKDFEYFDKRTIAVNERDDKVGAKALFMLRNREWREVRVKLTPAFTSGKIKRMLNLILKVSEELEDYIRQSILITDGVIDSKELSLKYTTDVISSCAFGINSQSFKSENADFVAAARSQFQFTVSRAIQFACYFMAPWLVKLFRMKILETNSVKFLRSAFWEQMHQRAASNIKRGDLIDILLEMKAENNFSLDGDVLLAQSIQFFIGGYETTGSTILFTLYELAANKDIQKRLRDEIKDTLAICGKISYNTIMDMKYLDNVISEALRKYPSLTFLDRRCSKTYTIPETNVTIQKGIPVYISLLGLHMDPEYFPEPERFDPDRFSEENRDSIKPFTYMPFGEGPRNCIGARFGLLSAKAATIAVVSNFELELDPSTPYPMSFNPKAGFLIAPKDGVLYLRYKPHSQNVD